MSTSSKITILGKSHRHSARVIVKCQLHTHVLLTDDVMLTSREDITFVVRFCFNDDNIAIVSSWNISLCILIYLHHDNEIRLYHTKNYFHIYLTIKKLARLTAIIIRYTDQIKLSNIRNVVLLIEFYFVHNISFLFLLNILVHEILFHN